MSSSLARRGENAVGSMPVPKLGTGMRRNSAHGVTLPIESAGCDSLIWPRLGPL
jgi:hypothetical protein